MLHSRIHGTCKVRIKRHDIRERNAAKLSKKIIIIAGAMVPPMQRIALAPIDLPSLIGARKRAGPGIEEEGLVGERVCVMDDGVGGLGGAVDFVDNFAVVVVPGEREERVLREEEDLARGSDEVIGEAGEGVDGVGGPGAVEFVVHEDRPVAHEGVVRGGEDDRGAYVVIGLEAQDVFEAGGEEGLEGPKDVAVVVEVDAAVFGEDGDAGEVSFVRDFVEAVALFGLGEGFAVDEFEVGDSGDGVGPGAFATVDSFLEFGWRDVGVDVEDVWFEMIMGGVD